MPLLVIEARGELVKSNFDTFSVAAREWIAGLNLTLRTDDDFEQASADSKKAKQIEGLLSETHKRTLESAVAVNAELEKLNRLSMEMRDVRLKLTKQIDTAKEELRKSMVEGSLSGIDCHKSQVGTFRPMIEGALKGLKSIDSMREKARVAVKVANDAIARSKKVLDEFEDANGRTLTPDREKLEVTDHVALATELRRRLERASHEAELKRIKEEQKATREQEARAQAVPVQSPPPVSTSDLPFEKPYTPAELEWDRFSSFVLSAFEPLKQARAELKYAGNIERAAAFAQSVADAWKTAKKGGKA